MAGRTKGKKAQDAAPTLKEAQAELAAAGRLNSRNADRHWLYEQSVQNVDFEVGFIDRVYRKEYGRLPRFFREDFCGTALLAAAWVQRRRGNSALGVDLDGPTLEWGRRHNLAELGDRAGEVTLVQDDVRNVTGPAADVLAATNFSWWGFKTRPELKAYLQGARECLKPEGMLLLDCFGGPEAQVPQLEEREYEGFTYCWDQDDFNPVTNGIRCLIHFEFPDGSRLSRAFRYDWRLWTMPETCDILAECGYRKSLVYWEGTDRSGEPSGIFRPSRKGDLAPAWVAYIIAFR
ncbi:class I SAM-dependent methyltransferase [bacterium]|nr:class I SAM-dependent methyltransferase [bacterium]